MTPIRLTGPRVTLRSTTPGDGAILTPIRNEPEVHPHVAEAGEELEASLAALVEAAGIKPADRAVVRAMVDLNTWQALRDQGLGPAEAVDAVSRMLAARVAQSA